MKFHINTLRYIVSLAVGVCLLFTNMLLNCQGMGSLLGYHSVILLCAEFKCVVRFVVVYT